MEIGIIGHLFCEDGLQGFELSLISCGLGGGGVPLKVKAFVWKLVQDWIPSLSNLSMCNVSLGSLLCKGCEREVERLKEEKHLTECIKFR